MSSSSQKTQFIDVVSLKTIFAIGDNNSILPANEVLTTDGNGGTKWINISTLQNSLTFNTIVTSQSTFTTHAAPLNTTFTILDSSTAGLLPTTSRNTVQMYAKSFGQINVAGFPSISAFDTVTGTVNGNLTFTGSGALTISTNSNIVNFYAPNDVPSSISSLIANVGDVNTVLISTIAAYKSPLTANIYTGALTTSTINMSGYRQPFTQYGQGTLNGDGISLITLQVPYVNSTYGIQITYTGSSGAPLYSSEITKNNFTVNGDAGGSFYWTTYGNLF